MILQLTIFTVTNISQEQFRSLVILNRAFIIMIKIIVYLFSAVYLYSGYCFFQISKPGHSWPGIF